jgi:predicted nucleotidyltransferase
VKPEISEALGSTLAAYRRQLELLFGPRVVSIRLFGSQARGDASPDSDADVAVVIRGLTDLERGQAIDLALEAWRSAGRKGPLISPLVWSDTEHADRRGSECQIALDVEREGIAL